MAGAGGRVDHYRAGRVPGRRSLGTAGSEERQAGRAGAYGSQARDEITTAQGNGHVTRGAGHRIEGRTLTRVREEGRR